MSETGGVIPFEPNGPAETGLVEWEQIDPAGLVAGEPVQRGHIYHEDPSVGYLTGVWDCTAFTTRMEPYPDDELMILLEGSLTLILPNGSEVNVKEGDAFAIPKGLEVQWKQPGYLRKFFMILSEPVAPDASNPSLRRITVPDLASPPPVEGPVETTETHFVNSTGNMTASLRSFAETVMPEHVARRNDLIHVLAGALTISSSGGERRIGPGETIYVVKGTSLSWKAEAGTRFLQSSYTPG